MSSITTIPGREEYLISHILPLAELNYSRGNPQPDFMPAVMMREGEIAFAPSHLIIKNGDDEYSLCITGYVSKQRISPSDIMVIKTKNGFAVQLPEVSYPEGHHRVPVEVLTP